MRRLALLALLLTACLPSGSSATNPTNAPSISSSTTTEPAAADETIVPETIVPQASELPPHPPALIANPDGVFVVSADALPARLEDGPAAIALEDLQGGIFFQRSVDEVGRSAIFWHRAGEAEPEVVVEPDGASALVLGGVTLRDEQSVIWYSRWTGTTPETLDQVAVTRAVPDGDPQELASIGGWDASATLRPAEDLLLSEWNDNGRRGLRFLDGSWNEVTVGANPLASDVAADCAACPRAFTISDDGVRLAWLETMDGGDDVVIAEVASRAETDRIALGAPTGDGAELDLHGDHVFVNTRDLDDTMWVPALSIRISDGRIELLGVPGRARIVRTADQAGGLAVP